jgi:hypothetical protein
MIPDQPCGAPTKRGTFCKLPRPCGHLGREPWLFWQPEEEAREEEQVVGNLIDNLREEWVEAFSGAIMFVHLKPRRRRSKNKSHRRG